MPTMKRLSCLALLLACGTQKPLVRATRDDGAFFCHYKKNGHYLPHGTLSLTPSGPPVMTFDEKAARATGVEIWLPWGGADQPIRGEFTTGWVTYKMYLKTSKPLVLYPTKPIQLGVLELGTSAPLEYLGTEGKGMRARVKPIDDFRSMRPMELSLECSETSIVANYGWMDERTDGGAPPKLELVEDQDIAVSMTPGGTADGVLRLKDRSWAQTAAVLEELPEYVRIRRSVSGGRVTGWISRQFTKPADVSDVYGVGGLLGGLGSRDGAGKPAWSRCASGVPLYVVENGRLNEAGELMANAAYEVVSEQPEWTEIRLPENAWLQLQPGYAWAFKPKDLEVCRTKPVKK